MVPWILELQQRFPKDPTGVTAELRLFHFNITPEMLAWARNMAVTARAAKARRGEMAEIDRNVDMQMQALGGTHRPTSYSAGIGIPDMLGSLGELIVLLAQHGGDPPFDAKVVGVATKVLRGELPPKAALDVVIASRPELAELRPMLGQALTMLEAFDLGGFLGGLAGGAGGVLGQLFGGQQTNIIDLFVMPMVILAAPRTELYKWVVHRGSPNSRLARLRRVFSSAYGQVTWAARNGRGEIATHLDHARMIAEQTPELEDDVAVIGLDARLRRNTEAARGLGSLVARLEHLVNTAPIPQMLTCTGALHDAAIEHPPGDPVLEQIVALRSKLLEFADQRLREAIPGQEWRAWAAASFEQFLAEDRREAAEAIVQAWPQRAATDDPEFVRLKQRLQQGPPQAEVLPRIAELFRQMTQIQRELIENDLQLSDRVTRLERLLELQRQRHSLLGRSNDPNILGDSISMLTMLAEGHENLGNRSLADALRKEADTLLNQIPPDHPVALDARRREVAVLRMRGHYNEALLALARFGDRARTTDDLLMWARWRLNEIDLLHWLGDHSRAEGRLREAATEVEAKHPRGELVDFATVVQQVTAEGDVEATQLRVWGIHGELCYYQGLLAHAQGRWDEAEPALRTAVEIYRGLGVDAALSVELLLARNAVAGGDPESGLAHLRELEARVQERQQLESRLPVVWVHEARALLQLGRAREALAELLRARAHEHSVDDPELHWRLDHVEGRVRRALGQPELALACYERAVETVGRQRNTSLGWRLDTTFLRDKQPLFAEAIELAAELHEVEVLCHLVESIKSRALSLMLRAPQATIQSDTSRASTLELEFDALGHQLDEFENTGLRPQESRTDRERNLAAVRSRRSELLERLRFADPRWRMVSTPPKFDIDDCIARLGDRRALQLYLEGSRIYAILVGGGELLEGRIDLDARIVERLSVYERNLAAPARGETPDPLSYDLSQRLRVGAKHLIPEALLEPAFRASSLIIVPHGRLHVVPWAALIYAGKRLFERVAVAVLPNLSCLARVDDGQRRPVGAVIGAPRYPAESRWAPLDEFADDLRVAAADYRQAGTLLAPPALHEDATKELLQTLLALPEADGGCLQIACHGDFVPDDPLRGGLQLADGKLDAASITRLRVAWADVVVSACNTGWRPDRVGELPLWGDDILGLPGALLEAGARSVLVSIPEATVGTARRFAREFQRRRSRGSLPLVAFSATQQAMLEANVPAWEWAGFTLYGSR